MDDKRIIGLYFERREQAVEETAKKYGRYCYAIAYNILSDPEDAEESVNDTYLDAWNAIPPHRPNSLALFLGKITRRISIDRWRIRNAGKRGGGETALVLEELYQCVASDANPEREFERKQLAQVINQFVKSLPGNEQKVFLCRYWYMDSIKSISQRFGYSESKVKSMLFRTREKLREVLRKEGY
ncbi:MAG: sigma-70 family RNA polymerase sigma factor [Oscillospiraceae bacterium]|nr:sigma-70 family RNA polymerase sigma factor [Oscillospiraceae bacterium]